VIAPMVAQKNVIWGRLRFHPSHLRTRDGGGKGDKKSLYDGFWLAPVVDSVKDIFVPIPWNVKTKQCSL